MPNQNAIETESPTLSDLVKRYDFLRLPEAEGAALVPLDPRKLLPYAGGSIIGQDLKTSNDLITKPLKNVKSAKVYIELAENKLDFYKRIGEVSLDTAAVNLISQLLALPSVSGPAAAGVYANQAAKRYDKKLKSTPNRRYILKKKQLKSNFQGRQNAVYKKLDKLNPTIGNAGGSNPTIKDFKKGGPPNSPQSRPFFSKKFFNRGGAQQYVIEMPTDQPHLLNTTQTLEVDYGSFVIYLILVFILIKKISSRVSKISSRFSNVKEKLFDIRETGRNLKSNSINAIGF